MAYHLVHPSPPELVPCLSPDRGLASVPGAAGAPCSQAREGFETNVSGRLVPGNINTSAGGGTRRDNSSAPQVAVPQDGRVKLMLQSLEMVTHATLTQFEAVSLTLQAEGLSLGTAGSQGSRTPTQETSLATFANLLQMLKGHAQAMQEKLNLIKPFENAADARKIGCGAPDDAAVTRASLAPSAAPPKHQTSALLPSSKHCVHTIALRNPRKLEVPQRMEMNFEEVTRVCGADVPTQCADAFNSIPRFPRASAKLENPRRSFPPRMQLSSSAPTAAAEQMSIPEVARLRRQNEALLQENSRLQAMSDRMSHQLRLAHSKMEGSTPPHGEIGVELHRRELEATRTSLQFAQLQLEKDRVRLQKREGILKAMLQNAMQEVAAARSGNTAAFSLPFDVADQEVRQAGGTGSQSDQDSGLMFEDSLQHEDPDSCDWLVEAHAAIMASIKHASFNPDGANAASKVKSDSQGRHRGRQQANRELPRQPHKKHVILGKDGALKQLPGSPVPAVALPFSPVAPSTTHGFRFRSPASDSKSKGPGQYGAWDTIVASETHAATQQALPAGSLQGPVEDHAPQLESLCRSPAQPFRPRKQASPAFPTAAGARIEALGLLSLPLSIADIMGGMETQLAVNVSEDLSRCLIGSVSGTDDGMPASFHSSGASSIHQNAGTWGHALLFSRSQQQDGKAAAAYMTADSSGNRKTLDKCNARRSQGPDRRRKASAGAEDNEQPLPTPCNVKALKRNLADEMQVFNKQNFHAKNKASGKRLFHSKENANNQAWLGHFR